MLYGDKAEILGQFVFKEAYVELYRSAAGKFIVELFLADELVEKYTHDNLDKAEETFILLTKAEARQY